MSICRRAFINDFFRSNAPARYTASVAFLRHHPSPTTSYSRPANGQSSHNSAIRSASTGKPHAQQNKQLSLKFEAISLGTSISTKETPVEVDPRAISPSHYKNMSMARSTSPSAAASLADLTERDYLHLFDVFTRQQSTKWLNSLLTDILFTFSAHRFQKRKLLKKLMLTGDFKRISSRTILLVTRFFKSSSDGTQFLQKEFLDAFLTKVCEDSSKADLKVLKELLPITLAKLNSLKEAPTGRNSLQFCLPPIVDASCLFIRKLIALGDQASALDVFQTLVKSSYVPAEALPSASSQVADFELVVMSSIARACLHWHKRSLALHILEHLVKIKGSSAAYRHQLHDLVVAVILSCLESPSQPVMLSVVRLIGTVHTFFPVPDGIVRQFYTTASTSDHSEAAANLFMFSRQADVEAQHHYPSPQGDGILPLMNYLSDHGHARYLRLLVQEATDGALLLPYNSRAHFIQIAVSHGMAGAARILWTRYSKTGDAVAGNAKLMIRMVNAFSHLSRTLGNSQNQAEASADCVAFADHVLASFRALHEPLREKAHHHTLNALARAYMIVGDFHEGFRMLRIIVKERRVPDLADINVAVTYFAEHSPVEAVKLIQIMIERHLFPDGQTFGVAIHAAAKKGDMSLVVALLKLTRECREVILTDRTMTSMIRTLVSPSVMRTLAPQDQVLRLEQVFDLLQNDLRDLRHAFSTHIGKYLVFASLRAKAAMLAFNFWKLLLKNREDWADREQIFIRRLIKEKITDKRVAKELRDEKYITTVL